MSRCQFGIHGDEALREEPSPSCFCKEVGGKIKTAVIGPTNTKTNAPVVHSSPDSLERPI